jgi:selenocysteine-specific elongation factor
MYTIGTAGHVDHGKSTLVRALTGIDPSRLKEERAREMTIDLGFAWLSLPPPLGEVGVIDVPGHRDFIENMLAGVGGIDASLLVVAADEGVMPQTREHLAIIDLLQLPTGVVALTKIDLAPDPDWLEMVRLDLSDVLAGTLLGNAPIVPVSARLGHGLDDLRAALIQVLTALPAPADIGQPRLWVDRVFSVSGFGTVVTGTLLGGGLAIGDDVIVHTGRDERPARIRGLQSHQRPIPHAYPGARVAVNLTGIDKTQVWRGCSLARPGAIQASTLADARFRHLADAPRPLRHNTEVKVFVGSSEALAHIRLLEGTGNDELQPGVEGWIQLAFMQPVPLAAGDKFIVRVPSPSLTIGGGTIIDPHPLNRWRRNHPQVIRRLNTLAADDTLAVLLQSLDTPMTIDALCKTTHLDETIVWSAIGRSNGAITKIGGEYWIGAEALQAVMDKAACSLAEFHRNSPLRVGMPSERLRGILSLGVKEFDAVREFAITYGLCVVRGQLIASPGHQIRYSRGQRAALDQLRAAFRAAPYTPPSVKEVAALVGDEVLTSLIEAGELVQVSSDVLFASRDFEQMLKEIRKILDAAGRIDVKTLRDAFNTSRKYALTLLEYLDGKGITRRSEDFHILASGQWHRVVE